MKKLRTHKQRLADLLEEKKNEKKIKEQRKLEARKRRELAKQRREEEKQRNAENRKMAAVNKKHLAEAMKKARIENSAAIKKAREDVKAAIAELNRLKKELEKMPCPARSRERRWKKERYDKNLDIENKNVGKPTESQIKKAGEMMIDGKNWGEIEKETGKSKAMFEIYCPRLFR